MDTTKLVQINKTNADNLLTEQKHQELLEGSVKVSDTVLSATVSLIKYLEGHVTKTQVINQLESIATPDALEVIPHIEALHATLKTHQNTDLTELTKLMSEMVSEAKLIPKDLPKTEKQQFVDYSDQFKSLKEAVISVGKFVKDQKTVVEAPVVNIEAPNVNIPPVDLSPLQEDIRDVVGAIKKIVIPEYKTDTEAVQKLIKASNVLLKKLLDKPVSSGGGGGGGRATPYQDANNIPAFVTLTVDGKIPVDLTMPAGGSTEAKQDLILTELEKKTEPSDIQNIEIINALRVLLQQIATPVWYDPTTNTLKVGTHAVTVSSGTVTTLTNQTNFGSNSADVMTRDISINTWANVARRTIS